MALVSRKGILAIAAVINVAIDARTRPVSAKALAAPAATSSRCCKRWCAMASWRGIRGPHGGYELGRERNRITADDILRAATTVDEVDAFPPNSALVNEIVWPALAETERTVSVALGRISIDDMVRRTTAAAK